LEALQSRIKVIVSNEGGNKETPGVETETV